MTSVANISPLDDRYQQQVAELAEFFSEQAVMRYRVRVEVEYLIALSREKKITQLPLFSDEDQAKLRSIFENFSSHQFQAIKKIEEETQHDVKALEYFLRRRLKAIGLGQHQNFIHFALTSEDINNLAYALMWRDGVRQAYIPELHKVYNWLNTFARHYKDLPILALTHGQPATPTSLGKEFAVFASRLQRQLQQLKDHKLQGKLSGATGTWAAHTTAYPDVNWIAFSKRFVKSLGLEPNLITTQIEPNDSLAESYHILIRVNTILLDLCRDLWLYISRGIFGQKMKSGEVGSSTMPHKVNPIHFENAEGNLGIATAYLSHLAQTLPVSRMQRDLSGSTVIRNQGVPLAHSLLACKNILKGLDRLTVNRVIIREELNDHWEVLAEAVQTILRKFGSEDAYEQLKKLTFGAQISQKAITIFVKSLDIPAEEKEKLLELSLESYIGLASKLPDKLTG